MEPFKCFYECTLECHDCKAVRLEAESEADIEANEGNDEAYD